MELTIAAAEIPWELPRRLLKISGGSVDDYATFSASSFTTPSC